MTGGGETTYALDDRSRKRITRSSKVEVDTFQCGHCGSVRHVFPKEDPANTGGLCKQCMKLICPKCLATGRCDPLEKKLERAEKRTMALKSYGL